jgi:hypothetical protein
MSYQDKMAVVNKIIELRSLFLELIEKNSDFDLAYDRVSDEINSFGRKTNIGINITVIIIGSEKFEELIKSDRVKDFIDMEIIKS